MQPNHLLALIGVALIATSATGLVLVEEKLPSEGKNWDLVKFLATFPIATGVVTGTGNTIDGSTDTATLTVTDANLTEGVFIFSWSDNRPRLSRFSASVSIDIQGPQGQTGNGQGDTGSITIELGRFNVPPNETELEAETSSDATKMMMDENPTTTNGTGAWTVSISVTRGGIAGPLRRGSIDWAAVIEYTNYSMSLAQLGGEEVPTPVGSRTSDAITTGVP